MQYSLCVVPHFSVVYLNSASHHRYSKDKIANYSFPSSSLSRFLSTSLYIKCTFSNALHIFDFVSHFEAIVIGRRDREYHCGKSQKYGIWYFCFQFFVHSNQHIIFVLNSFRLPLYILRNNTKTRQQNHRDWKLRVAKWKMNVRLLLC